MEKRGKKVSKTEKHAIFFLAENEAKCQIFGGYFCIMTNFLRLIWYMESAKKIGNFGDLGVVQDDFVFSL